MNKKTNKKKKKLTSMLLLLFITVIMLGTSTYAWFTANQTVTINSLDVHVEASNGLQISTNATTWKTAITNEDITTNAYATNINMVPTNLNAVSTVASVNTATNLLKMYKGTIASDKTTGAYTITSALSPEAKGSTGDYVAFDIFLKVEKAETIYLSAASNVSFKATETVTTDRGLENSARVGFMFKGHGGSDDPVETVGTTTGLVDLTNYIGDTDHPTVIWEPNANKHTASALTVASQYGVKNGSDALTDGVAIGYYGLNAEFTTAQDMIKTVKGDTNTNTTAITTSSSSPKLIQTNNGFTSNTQIFKLEAGVTKIRVYMWIEGQDIDCENNASGSDISYNVILTTLSE